jgi:hypothetical protein
MIQCGNGAGLAIEAIPEPRIGGNVRGQDFDRHGTVEARVVGLVDLAHAASTQPPDDLVRPQFRSGLQNGLRRSGSIPRAHVRNRSMLREAPGPLVRVEQRVHLDPQIVIALALDAQVR